MQSRHEKAPWRVFQGAKGCRFKEDLFDFYVKTIVCQCVTFGQFEPHTRFFWRYGGTNEVCPGNVNRSVRRNGNRIAPGCGLVGVSAHVLMRDSEIRVEREHEEVKHFFHVKYPFQ